MRKRNKCRAKSKIPKVKSKVPKMKSNYQNIKSKALSNLERTGLDNVTRIYPIPSAQYQTEADVIKSFGYKIIKQIDKGGFGRIYMCLDLRKKIKVALKEMTMGIEANNPELLDTKNELSVLEKVRHPYVIRLYCHFIISGEGRNRMFIFMELADGSNFYKFLSKRNKLLTEEESKGYYAQILCGLNHMHQMGIAHRDVKLQNVLLISNRQSITGDYLLVITDFGLSRCIPQATDPNALPVLSKTFCGTPAFMAPELYMKRPYDAYKVDMWALGVSLYMMLTLEIPFELDQSKKQIISDMLKRRWKFPDSVTASNDLKFVMKSMLEPNFRTRISLNNLIAHRWISQQYIAAHNLSDAIKQKELSEVTQ